jgi:hypothetical protein
MLAVCLSVCLSVRIPASEVAENLGWSDELNTATLNRICLMRSSFLEPVCSCF